MSLALRRESTPILQEIVRDIITEELPDIQRITSQPNEKLAALVTAGSTLWLDTGDAAAAASVWASEFTGLTTNNTLVNQVVQTGYLDSLILRAAKAIRNEAPSISSEDLVAEIGFIANARLANTLIKQFGVKVSVELHPRVARDIENTVELGKRYFALNPDWYIIKVPLTPEGYLAVRKLSDDGIPVNYTLGFSARQNYLASHLSRPAFVNIFLGRLNQVAAENKLSDGRNIGEKVCLASQKAINQARSENTAISTKQIAASLRSGEQCLTLAGVDVHTIPPKAAKEFLESIPATDKIEANLDANLPVVFDGGKTAEELGFEMLWTLDEAFCKFAKQAAAQSSALSNGKDLIELAADCGVADLFYPFTESHLRQITDDGKIPVLARWNDRSVALDDLMTVSALQSFTKDQAALDARILDLAGKA